MDPETPEAFAAHVRNTLFKGFAIPVAILIFFAFAPAWLDHNIHSSIASSVAREAPAAERAARLESLDRIDFAAVCGGTMTGYDKLRANLEQAGICGQFARLKWGQGLSVLLLAILIGVTTGTYLLNRRAQRSRADLIAAYRHAWRLSIVAALAKVLLLIPLLGYGTFELTTLAFERFYPKLILIIVVGGLVALWKSITILLKPVPMEFEAPMARAIKPEETPALWTEARAAAAKLGTTPPDHIIVGMEHNFYVTELAVTYRGGRAEGRTLYLSLPLMQHLAPAEVMAIIGHELGHFRGEDTRITREFYPLRLKAQATLHALAESGWVGWTSVHALLFFHGSFARTEQAMSREREFAADQAAAELTSSAVIADALRKIHVYAEAFVRALKQNPKENPFAVSLPAFVRAQLVANDDFWRDLFEQKSAHPLDSHPPLRLRLQALGASIDPAVAKAVTSADIENGLCSLVRRTGRALRGNPGPGYRADRPRAHRRRRL